MKHFAIARAARKRRAPRPALNRPRVNDAAWTLARARTIERHEIGRVTRAGLEVT